MVCGKNGMILIKGVYKMNKSERCLAILELLKKERSVDVNDLAERFET